MWLTEISLQNIRGFASATVSLDRPVTVLVGANGSGKTTMLRAIAAAATRMANELGAPIRPLSLGLNDIRALEQSATVALRAEVAHAKWMLRGRAALPAQWSWLSPAPENEGTAPAAARSELGVLLAETDRNGDTSEARTGSFRRAISDRIAEARGKQLQLFPVLQPGYRGFSTWFKQREDAENAMRVARRDFGVSDPALDSIRRAIAAIVPGVSDLRVDRSAAVQGDQSVRLLASKGGLELSLSDLADGERSLLLLSSEIVRCAASLRSDGDCDLLDTPLVVLIDEVEQHLHPAWQRQILPLLQQVFPKAQWIVSTHSPQVVASVSADAVLVLHEGAVLTARTATQGRDTNAILRAIFGISERPEIEQREVDAISALIDAGSLDDAKRRLRLLATRLSDEDEAVTRLQTRLDFAEVGL